MTTTIPTKIGKRAGALTKQREVVCPTCHAPIGAFCVTVGRFGSATGNVMPTSCHNARIIAAGLTPRSSNRGPKPAVTHPKGSKSQRISRALKLSWAKRKQEEAEAVLKFSLPKIKLDSSKAPAKSGARTHMLRVGPEAAHTLYELVADVLEQLRVKPNLAGASVTDANWSVSAIRSTPKAISIGIAELEG